MESLLGFDPTLLLGKYWSTFSSNLSNVYILSVGVCFFVAVLTVCYTATRNDGEDNIEIVPIKNKRKKKRVIQDVGSFEICPDDEVTFQSLLSPEELQMEEEKQSQSRFQPLDQTSPTKHIEDFLRAQSGRISDSDDEDTLTEEEDEIGSASSLMGRVKLARQEAIRKKMESEMSEKDILKENMIQQQQLARIFSLLAENQDSFGSVSFDDVQRQMHMYTPPSSS